MDIITAILLTLFTLSWPFFVGKTLKILRGKLGEFMERHPDPTKNDLEVAKQIALRGEELWYFAHFFGVLEVFIFSVVFYVLFKNPGTYELRESFMDFLTVVGGWLGIKTLASHKPWALESVGKSYFHLSLFGTLLNISVAILVGIFLVNQ